MKNVFATLIVLVGLQMAGAISAEAHTVPGPCGCLDKSPICMYAPVKPPRECWPSGCDEPWCDPVPGRPWWHGNDPIVY